MLNLLKMEHIWSTQDVNSLDWEEFDGNSSYRGKVGYFYLRPPHRLLNMRHIDIAKHTHGVFVFDVKCMFLAVVAIPCGSCDNFCNVSTFRTHEEGLLH